MASRAARLAAIQRLAVEVEKRWGGLWRLRDGARVEYVESLERGSLERLTRHETLGVVVRGFLERGSAEALGAKLAGVGEARTWSVSNAHGLEASEVRTLGTPFNVAVGEGAVEAYYDDVRPTADKLRALSGGASPLDRLRAELDDAWPGGACAARDRRGRTRHAGLARIMCGPTRQGFVHVDDLNPLRPDQGLFSANIYLQLPDTGGHLELWPLGFRSRWEFYANAYTLSALTVQDPRAQLRLRTRLAEAVLVHPQPGDLVLLCVQRPHAVAGFDAGDRVSLQSFITHQGAHKALLLEN